jgi:outer membrane biosynthesis protein TonB
LLASIIFHTVIFYNWPLLKNLPVLRIDKPLEVTYYSPKKIHTAPPPIGIIDKQEKIGRQTAPALSETRPISTAFKTIKGDDAVRIKSAGKETIKLNDNVKIAVEKIIPKSLDTEKDGHIRLIPSQDKALISYKEKDYSNEPAYISYYNGIRSKIYGVANANKPYYYMEGEVKLVFSIARTGELLSVNIIPEGSITNPILRNHALLSIKRSGPFAPFGELIKEDHLTLRLTISFEK